MKKSLVVGFMAAALLAPQVSLWASDMKTDTAPTPAVSTPSDTSKGKHKGHHRHKKMMKKEKATDPAASGTPAN